jgi:catechol 2,3-dioxygenase-like lactoylglutathione lyase family enzyme
MHNKEHRMTLMVVVVASFALVISSGCAESVKQCGQSNQIRFEHIALNVKDPEAVVKWYCQNLDMKVVRKGLPPVNMHFVADAGGNMMFEFYNSPGGLVLDYNSMSPQSLHIAFMVEDVLAVRDRLLAVGATIAEDTTTTPAGDQILIMRDPWGLPIQFVKRSQPMLNDRR